MYSYVTDVCIVLKVPVWLALSFFLSFFLSLSHTHTKELAPYYDGVTYHLPPTAQVAVTISTSLEPVRTVHFADSYV